MESFMFAKPFNYHFLILLTAIFMSVGLNIEFFSKLSTITTPSTLALTMLFMIFLFSLALELLSYMWSVKIVCAFFITLSSVSSYFISVLHIGITPDIIQSTLNTNLSEAQSFLNPHLFLYLLATCIFPLFLLYKLKLKRTKLSYALLTKLFCVGIYLVGSYGLWFGVVGKDLVLQLRPLSSLITPISPIRSSVLLYNAKAKASMSYQHIALDAKLKDSKKRILVLVIGESVRSENLNDYPRELMPKFKPQSVSFKDFSSCGVITAISVPCMLTSYTHSTYTNRYLSDYIDNILDITQRVGIATYWLDNNSGSSKACIGGLCDRLKEKYYFDGYDGVMFEKLKELLAHTTQSSFFILHTYGSHGPDYFNRYPKEFEIHKPTCQTSALNQCSSEEVINSYDNSILYTDSLLEQIITWLKGMQDFEVSLWFISDHGESLGEGGNYMHGGLPYSLSPSTQTKVASLMWFGDRQSYLSLKAKENTPLSQDYVFHSILGYFGITTKDYDKKLDLLKQGE